MRDRSLSRRTTAVVFAAVALTFLVTFGLLIVYGPGAADETDAAGNTPHASFTFSEQSVTVADGEGNTTRTAVVITHRSGSDLPQDNVTVTVNGAEGWDLRPTEEEYNATVRPWNESGGSISAEPARIVVYDDLDADHVLEEEGSDYYTLEEGDVIEVVWRGSERDLAVLQRYVVGE